MSSPIVYVVDDDDACRRALGSLLPAFGVTTQTFRSANEFLEQLPPDSMGCLITDMRMPDVNGVELMKQLRRIDPNLPVIIVSGAIGAAGAERAAELGAVAVLEKPFDIGQLKEKLDFAFGLLKERRAASSHQPKPNSTEPGAPE
jgi:two-component system, LuxR family, response regulator FixJ